MGTSQARGKEPMSTVEQEAAFGLDNLKEHLKERDDWLDRFRPDALCDVSILAAPLDDERRRVQQVLEHSSDPSEDRCLGAMLGLALGDALGAPLEFSELRYGSTQLKDMGQEEIWKIDPTALDRGCSKNEFGYNKFELKPGQFTDDTAMALCLADSLLAQNGFNAIDLRLRFLNWWQLGYNNAFKLDADWRRQERCGSVGLGGNIGASMREFQEEPAEFTASGDRLTNGNGSIMRLAPCAIFFRGDPEAALAVAAQQSKTTHQGDEAAECCRLLAHILLGAFQGPPRDVASAAGRRSARGGAGSARSPSAAGAGSPAGLRSSSTARSGAAGKSSTLALSGRSIAGRGVAHAENRSRGGGRADSPGPASRRRSGSRGGSSAPAGGISTEASAADVSSSAERFKRWLLTDWCASFQSRLHSVECLAASKAEDKLTAESAGLFGSGEHVVMVDELPVREAEDADSKILTTLPLGSNISVQRAHSEEGYGLLSEPIVGWVDRFSAAGQVQLVKPDWKDDRNWNWQAPDFRYAAGKKDLEYIGSYAMDNLCMALHCVWTTHDYRSAVLKSANLRGDADTVSAVTGQIAGAIYGASSMPTSWFEQLFRWDGGDVALKAWLLYHREDSRLLAKALGRASKVRDDKEGASAGAKPLERSAAAGRGKTENVVLVGIAGPTRGGKSSLAHALRSAFPGSGTVNQDRYFKRDGETPDCIDFRRMKSDLRRLLASAEKEATSKNPVVVVAEGFLLFADEELESWFDVRIFLRLDKELCYARRLETKKAGLAGEKFDRFFEKSIWPAHEAHGAPHLEGAHVLDGSKPQEDILAAAADLVQNALDALSTAARGRRTSGSRA